MTVSFFPSCVNGASAGEAPQPALAALTCIGARRSSTSARVETARVASIRATTSIRFPESGSATLNT